jgi:hypothetical protein
VDGEVATTVSNPVAVEVTVLVLGEPAVTIWVVVWRGRRVRFC